MHSKEEEGPSLLKPFRVWGREEGTFPNLEPRWTKDRQSERVLHLSLVASIEDWNQSWIVQPAVKQESTLQQLTCEWTIFFHLYLMSKKRLPCFHLILFTYPDWSYLDNRFVSLLEWIQLHGCRKKKIQMQGSEYKHQTTPWLLLFLTKDIENSEDACVHKLLLQIRTINTPIKHAMSKMSKLASPSSFFIIQS